MIKRAAYFISVLLLVGGGCVDRIMTITSDPEGAVVYLNDQEIGRTPFTHDFQDYGNYEVEVRKDDYQTVKGNQVMEEPWWQLIPLDLITDLAPWHLKDIRHYHYTMLPASTEPADAQVMLTRAAQIRALLLSSKNTRIPTSLPTSEPGRMTKGR